MSLANISDPFESVDNGNSPEKEEKILLERIDASYYKNIISWFSDRILTHIKPQRVLEVGCGTGHVLDSFCSQADAKIEGYGVDRSKFLADRTAKRFPHLNIQSADGRDLPFEDDFFDVCFIATVLVHANEPEKIIDEMTRVVNPDGLVVLIDQDFETALLYPGERELTRRILTSATDFWNDGWIGRKLPSMLSQAGLEVIDFTSEVRIDREFDKEFFRRIRDWVIKGGFSSEDADQWFENLCKADKKDFVFSRNFYCAIGRQMRK